MIAWLQAQMTDRAVAVSLASVLIVPVTLWFMIRCLMWHRESRKPWDTGAFGLNFGGAVAAAWFLAEAMLDVGDPPAHWRIYVVVLSFALLHHSVLKCMEMWITTRKTPAPASATSASAGDSPAPPS